MDAERGVVLAAAEVRALLEKGEVELRRVMKPQPSAFVAPKNRRPTSRTEAYFDSYCNRRHTPENPRGMSDHWCWWTPDDRQGPDWIRCPFGSPGDRLWVRETWDFRPWGPGSNRVRIAYEADGAQMEREAPDVWNPTIYSADRWRSPVLLPRWASRLTAEVVEVRVERGAAGWEWVGKARRVDKEGA